MLWYGHGTQSERSAVREQGPCYDLISACVPLREACDFVCRQVRYGQPSDLGPCSQASHNRTYGEPRFPHIYPSRAVSRQAIRKSCVWWYTRPRPALPPICSDGLTDNGIGKVRCLGEKNEIRKSFSDGFDPDSNWQHR
jgi:hypothetical protein